MPTVQCSIGGGGGGGGGGGAVGGGGGGGLPTESATRAQQRAQASLQSSMGVRARRFGPRMTFTRKRKPGSFSRSVLAVTSTAPRPCKCASAERISSSTCGCVGQPAGACQLRVNGCDWSAAAVLAVPTRTKMAPSVASQHLTREQSSHPTCPNGRTLIQRPWICHQRRALVRPIGSMFSPETIATLQGAHARDLAERARATRHLSPDCLRALKPS